MSHLQVSEIVRSRFVGQGDVSIPLLNGKRCVIRSEQNGTSFSSDKLNQHKVIYDYSIFDIIAEQLRHAPRYTVPKGSGRGKEDKVGYGKCTEDTVLGNLAIKYMGKQYGDSCFDPVFVLAAVLDYAGVAHNERGVLKLDASCI